MTRTTSLDPPPDERARHNQRPSTRTLRWILSAVILGFIALLPVWGGGVGTGVRDCQAGASAIDAASERWKDHGPRSYAFTYDVPGTDWKNTYRITVRDGTYQGSTRIRGEWINTIDAQHGAPPTPNPFPPLTIESLIETVRAACPRAHDADAEFDAALGYPIRAFIDEDVIHDTSVFLVSEVTPLDGTNPKRDIRRPTAAER
jgi:hypothetical protein